MKISGLFLLMVILGCTPRQSDVPLRAEVDLDRKDLDTMGNPMYIEVTNNDPFDWNNCVTLANLSLEIYRDLEPQADHIRRGETVKLTLMKFQQGVNGGGPNMDPRFIINVALKCETPNGIAVYSKVFGRRSSVGHEFPPHLSPVDESESARSELDFELLSLGCRLVTARTEIKCRSEIKTTWAATPGRRRSTGSTG